MFNTAILKGENASLTIKSGVTVNNQSDAAGKNIFAVGVLGKEENNGGSAKGITVNIEGKLVAKKGNPLVTVSGRVTKDARAAKINIADGAVLESTGSAAIYQAGYAETTIGKATISGTTAIMLRAGKMTVNGATVNGTLEGRVNAADMGGGMNDSGAAIQVESTNKGNYISPATLVVNGGTYTSKANSAVVINNNSEELVAISKDSKIEGGASLVSGPDTESEEDDAMLPAIQLLAANEDSKDTLLTNLTGFVVNAKSNGPLVSAIKLTSGGSVNAADVQAKLVNGNVTTDDEGNTVVGTVDENKTPEDQGNTGDGANTPDEGTTGRLPDQPAKTNDNILVYAGLGLVSALSVGFSAKRKENN